MKTDQYLPFDSGLKISSKYLTEELAYFLGGMYAAEEQVSSSGKNYKIFPVRYNYGAATEIEITEHYELVKSMSKRMMAYTAMAENIRKTELDSGKNRMPGFSTFFETTKQESLMEMAERLQPVLEASPWNVRRSFLVGVFDGRSSADINKQNHNVRMLSLDCITDEVGAFLSEILEMSNLRYNYNTHRDRLEGGKPRNPQLRIKDVDDFIGRVGLISPRRINLLKRAYEYNYSSVEIQNEDNILVGLKTIHMR